MKLKQLIGQENIINDLLIHIKSALSHWTPIEHTMFYGPAGLGKSTLAEAIAEELGSNVIQKTGQEVKIDVLYEAFEELKIMDIFFIDEIHATPTKTLEILYGPMQIINNMKLDNVKMLPFKFQDIIMNPFTVIGATTSAGRIAKPMRDRMILAYDLHLYSIKELAFILIAKKCPAVPAFFIAQRSRGIPRVALNYFQRIRNEAIYAHKIHSELCQTMFNRIGVDNEGYNINDRRILIHLSTKTTVSESELYRTLFISSNDYRNMHEPFLLSKGVMSITSKGRTLTEAGKVLVKEMGK